MDTQDVPLDLDAYFRRIGCAGPREPTAEVLEALQLAHATHIPFENLDILLGRPIRLDLASLQAKILAGRRGGYCFEHNRLFWAVLEAMGYAVTPLAARVRLGSSRLRARTHMLLMVTIDQQPLITDVGFGAGGLLHPLPLVANRPVRIYAWQYRLIREGALWVLQTRSETGWFDLYAFTLERQYSIDYEVANYYVSTHPASQFTQGLFVQQATPTRRCLLNDDSLTIEQAPGKTSVREIKDENERLGVLADVFDLHFPPGTAFDNHARQEGTGS
jgi:N-hydroxyarylamine O-acetyltransferase